MVPLVRYAGNRKKHSAPEAECFLAVIPGSFDRDPSRQSAATRFASVATLPLRTQSGQAQRLATQWRIPRRLALALRPRHCSRRFASNRHPDKDDAQRPRPKGSFRAWQRSRCEVVPSGARRDPGVLLARLAGTRRDGGLDDCLARRSAANGRTSQICDSNGKNCERHRRVSVRRALCGTL